MLQSSQENRTCKLQNYNKQRPIIDKESTTNIFFNILRCALGSEYTLPNEIGADVWHEIFETAKKQTLVGVMFNAFEKLHEKQRPPKNILMQWIVICEHIKNENKKLNDIVVKVSDKFRKEGFENVVLKGQGVAVLYPQPLLRVSGDIDIWLDGDKRSIIKYVRQFFPDCKPVYHHVDFPIIKEAAIEIHFTPTWMNNYFSNRKLQRFFKEHSKKEYKNFTHFGNSDKKAPCSTLAFNRVYILVHIYRHLFSEGIGLRQLLDYYYVLKQGFTDAEKQETLNTLKELGMMRFAGATMYVLHKAFGLEERFMLTKPRIEDGDFLLQEIMLAGNFGHYDERIKHEEDNIFAKRVCSRMLRNMRFIRMYPSEVIWAPIFKTWHFFWRKFI
ncbi:MAG: nucleotidyltransferase family protein [Bacteroidaceae bacterium]|nr:nucleotidyltransferase family protein [Bacteroidaceae bacterium]